MLWIVFGLVALTGLWAALSLLREKRRAALRLETAMRIMSTVAPQQRLQELWKVTRFDPDNSAAWYYLGAIQLRDGHVRDAARSFGMAYHRNCDLETAALFTFACLKSREGAQTDVVEQLLKTRSEMREGDIPRKEMDIAVTRCLCEASEGARSLSDFGAVVWSSVGPFQRRQIEQLLTSEAGRALVATSRPGAVASAH